MKALNLYLQCGSRAATLNEISDVPTPQPDGLWHPISHRRLYDQVNLALDNMGMRVVNEQHGLYQGGARYFGLLQIGNGSEAGDDFSYVLGLRNSHDKSFSAGLVVGAGVFVCDNLSFNGEIKIARKHTTFIERDLPALTARAVGQLSEKWKDMSVRFDAYKQREISDTQAHDLIIRGMDVGACTGQQIPKIVKEWRHPRHDEFEQSGKTAWRLFNAFTQIHQEGSLLIMPKRSQSLHAILDAECEIISQSA